MRWAADQRTLNFYQGNVFLSAALGTGLVNAVAPKAEDWEAFLPVSQAALDALRELLGSSWLVRSTGALVERPAMWRFFNLLLGNIAVDLRYQFPLDLANWPHRLTLLRDGWRIEQLCLYRPLVYYAAFGSPAIMQQFAASVVSLIEFGRYQGHIAVLTDHSQAQLAELLPADVLARIAVVQFKPSDRPGFMTARYLILDLPNAWKFQPILYIDADVMFDRDVAPMLREIAVSDRIAAPFEPFSALRRSPPSGATLLQRDYCSPGDVAGFQHRHDRHSQPTGTCRDPAPDPPDHCQPQSAAWAGSAPLRRPGDRELRRLSPGQFRYHADCTFCAYWRHGLASTGWRGAGAFLGRGRRGGEGTGHA